MQIFIRLRVWWPWRRLGEYLMFSSICKLYQVVIYVIHSCELGSGPKIPFRLGREDATSGDTSPKECGLPDADKGSRKNTIQHIRDVFYRELKHVYLCTLGTLAQF